MSDSERNNLFNVLEAHGQAFLKSFGPMYTTDSSKRRKMHVNTTKKQRRRYKECGDEENDEWYGVCVNSSTSDHVRVEGEREAELTTFSKADNRLCVDDNVVVFSDVAAQKPHLQRPLTKAFMSSRISKLSNQDSQSRQIVETSSTDKEDRTNLQNDVLLHKLIHTKLLSGSLDNTEGLLPEKKRKVLAGRILELTGNAKLGKGEQQLYETERKRAAKRIREGIAQKQRQRKRSELEQAKNLGNYHPILKKVYDTSTTSSIRKRKKGLGMGIGKFSNGFLHLRKDDISRVISEGNQQGRGNDRSHFKNHK